MSPLFPPRPRKLSCGIVVFSAQRELLLCHVTGQRHWDLPKGGLHAGETPGQAALRETAEETSLRFEPGALLELGRFPYTSKKDLHLFATLSERIDTGRLYSESTFLERSSGRTLPEMDGFGWFAFERIAGLCTPHLTTLLEAQIDLGALFDRLVPAPPERLAA